MIIDISHNIDDLTINNVEKKMIPFNRRSYIFSFMYKFVLFYKFSNFLILSKEYLFRVFL